MKAIAAFTGRATPEFVEIPNPSEPGAGEVLCRTLELGVCGTDREILHSETPWNPPGEEFLVLGHECLAQVEAVGDDVAELQVGDFVTPAVRRATIASPIRPDFMNFGDYIERGIVHAHGFSAPLWLDEPQFLFPVEKENTSFAVFAEPLSIAEKAINEALLLQQARLGEDMWIETPPRVLVTGMGPIGFAGIIASVARGWSVTMYGRDAEDTFRVNLAKRFGANYLPDTALDSFEDEFDLILECTGSDAVLVAVAEKLAPRAAMVWLGAARQPEPKMLNVQNVMRNALLGNQLHLGAINASARDFHDALMHLEMMQDSHRSEMSDLFTDRVGQQDALWHYQNRQPQGIKTVVMYGS